jgi:hypothetical protein
MKIKNRSNTIDFRPRNVIGEPAKPKKYWLAIGAIFGVLVGVGAGYSFLAYSAFGVNPLAVSKSTPVNNFQESNVGTVQAKPFDEVMAFLKTDQTNVFPYTAGIFDCKEYSLITWLHATGAGFECDPVLVKLDAPTSHMIIAFQTTDKGVVFIEPQGDLEVFPATWTKWDGYTILGLYYLDTSTTPVLNSYPPFT